MLKTILLSTILLSACSAKEPNYAEVLVKGQVPDASCESAVLKGVSVTLCTIKDADILAAYGKGYPFQANPLKKPAPKAEAPAPVNPPYDNVDAGVIKGNNE